MFQSAHVRGYEEQGAILQQICPILQGHVIGPVMDAFRNHTSYLRGMRPQFEAALSSELHATLYAPSEVVQVERALCAARRGIGWRGGRVVLAGHARGQDAILYHHLRDLTPLRCLGYFGVLSLQVSALFRALRRPARHVKFIAKASEDLRENAGAEMSSLSKEERLYLSTDIITNGALAVRGVWWRRRCASFGSGKIMITIHSYTSTSLYLYITVFLYLCISISLYLHIRRHRQETASLRDILGVPGCATYFEAAVVSPIGFVCLLGHKFSDGGTNIKHSTHTHGLEHRRANAWGLFVVNANTKCFNDLFFKTSAIEHC